jgi:hypothetical protein
MADEADLAQSQIEADLALHIRNARKPAAPAPTGYCLNCDERLKDGRRYCDDACRADGEARDRHLRRAGQL